MKQTKNVNQTDSQETVKTGSENTAAAGTDAKAPDTDAKTPDAKTAPDTQPKAPETNAGTEEPKAKSKSGKAEKASSEVKKMKADLQAAEERYLRLMAEYDNFRKRSSKEKDSIYSDAQGKVFTELIPVLDNFDRAIDNEDAGKEDYKKGIEMTHKQLADVLTKAGVTTFGKAGEKFDPNIHNAVMHVDDPELGTGVIAEVFQKGYKLHDKVLRHAMVKVAN